MSTVPFVVEQTSRGERSYDIFSKLLADRIIFLGEEATDQAADRIIAQMLFLEGDDPDSDIQLYINSPGGSVTAGLAISKSALKTVKFSAAPITKAGDKCSDATFVSGARSVRTASANTQTWLSETHGIRKTDIRTLPSKRDGVSCLPATRGARNLPKKQEMPEFSR